MLMFCPRMGEWEGPIPTLFVWCSDWGHQKLLINVNALKLSNGFKYLGMRWNYVWCIYWNIYLKEIEHIERRKKESCLLLGILIKFVSINIHR